MPLKYFDRAVWRTRLSELENVPAGKRLVIHGYYTGNGLVGVDYDIVNIGQELQQFIRWDPLQLAYVRP